MFEVLVLSAAPRQVRTRWLSTAVVAHAVVIALAVAATGKALDSVRTAPNEVSLLFVPTPPKPEPPPPVERAPEPAAPSVVVAEPPPKGFQTVAAPQDIPTVIPPVDLSQRPLDPRDFTGRGVEGGVADGVIGGTGPVTSDLEAGALDAIYEATTTDDRFTPAIPLTQPAVRYPAALAAGGIEGRVQLEFVIDTTGKVETASVRVLERSHQAFVDAARATVLGARFRPARFGTRPVRQLTRQAVRFVSPR